AGRDRLPAAVLLVLPGIAVERSYHGDPLRRRPLERVDHQEMLHDPLVDRSGVTLDYESIGGSRRLIEAGIDLTGGELVGAGGRGLDAEPAGDLSRKLGVGPAGEQQQLLLASGLDATHVAIPSLGRRRRGSRGV